MSTVGFNSSEWRSNEIHNGKIDNLCSIISKKNINSSELATKVNELVKNERMSSISKNSEPTLEELTKKISTYRTGYLLVQAEIERQGNRSIISIIINLIKSIFRPGDGNKEANLKNLNEAKNEVLSRINELQSQYAQGSQKEDKEQLTSLKNSKAPSFKLNSNKKYKDLALKIAFHRGLDRVDLTGELRKTIESQAINKQLNSCSYSLMLNSMKHEIDLMIGGQNARIDPAENSFTSKYNYSPEEKKILTEISNQLEFSVALETAMEKIPIDASINHSENTLKNYQSEINWLNELLDCIGSDGSEKEKRAQLEKLFSEIPNGESKYITTIINKLNFTNSKIKEGEFETIAGTLSSMKVEINERINTITNKLLPDTEQNLNRMRDETSKIDSIASEISLRILARTVEMNSSNEVKDNFGVMFPGGTIDHAMMYKVQRQESGMYTFSILNTGLGVENHHRSSENPEKYQTHACFSNLTLDQVSDVEFIKRLLHIRKNVTGEESQRSDGALNINQIYDVVKSHFQQGMDPPSKNPQDYHKTQIHGTCTQQVTNTWMHQLLYENKQEPLYRKMKADMTDHLVSILENFDNDQKKELADQILHEMKKVQFNRAMKATKYGS